MASKSGRGNPRSRATWENEKQALVNDLTELRSTVIALCAKLDLDGGVGDEDYESTLTPAALETKV